jgi:hypothetical protein
MGRKVSDGKAFDAVAPAGQVINDYDLFRIGGWNGCAVGAKDAAQADRTMSFECDPAAIYSKMIDAGIRRGDKAIIPQMLAEQIIPKPVSSVR